MTPPENLESQENNNKITGKDLLWQMIPKLFPNTKIKNPWKSYKDFANKPENKKRLVAMEKAEREKQRSDGKKILEDGPYIGGSEQNLRIREAILGGRVLPLEKEAVNTYTGVDNLGLSKDKIAYIKATTTSDQYDFYMKSMPNKIINDFKVFDSETFASFWDEEMEGIEKKKEYIQSIGGSEMTQDGINKIGTINWLMDIDPRIEKMKEKNINKDPKIKEAYDREVQNKKNSYKKNNPQNYEKLLQQCDGDQALIDKMITEQVELDVFNEFREKGIITLDKEDEIEFAKLNVEFYEKMKEWGLEVVDSIKNAYTNAVKYLNSLYNSSSTYKEISGKVLTDPQLDTFFDRADNQVERFSEEQKSLSYYKQIIKLYPDSFKESKTKEGVSLREYIDAKDTTVSSLKEKFPDLMTKVKNCEIGGEGIVKKTNMKVKEVAVKQCLTALQKSIDIEVNDQQNVIDQLELEKNLDAVVDQGQDIMINVKGSLKISGEKISLSYNLVTGQVYCHKYMKSSSSSGQNAEYLSFGDYSMKPEEMEKDQIPFMKLPTLGSIISKGKRQNTDYINLMEKSEDITSYEKNVEDELMKEYSLSENIEYEVGKDMLKKQILQDMIVQKLTKVCRRTIKDGEVVTQDQRPDTLYNLYNYFKRSLEYYGGKSINNLVTWDTYMNKLLKIQESPDYGKRENSQNKRGFVLHNIMTPAIIGERNMAITDQSSEGYIFSFFQCFKTTTGGLDIVDIDKMKKYFEIADQSVENPKIEKGKNQKVFNKLYADIDSKISGKAADIDVERKLELMDDAFMV